jgi:hypothetical protein
LSHPAFGRRDDKLRENPGWDDVPPERPFLHFASVIAGYSQVG